MNQSDIDMAEEWRTVVGYEQEYEVSNLGRVRSLARQCIKRGIEYNVQALVLKQFVSGHYLAFNVCKHGVRKQFHIHRLVCKAFHDNPENKPEVNHLDGNKLNNRSDNLEWSTRKENSLHSYSIGLQAAKRGGEVKRSVPVLQFTVEGLFVRRFAAVAEAARVCKINLGNIRRSCKEKIYAAGGFKWIYEREAQEYYEHEKQMMLFKSAQ